MKVQSFMSQWQMMLSQSLYEGRKEAVGGQCRRVWGNSLKSERWEAHNGVSFTDTHPRRHTLITTLKKHIYVTIFLPWAKYVSKSSVKIEMSFETDTSVGCDARGSCCHDVPPRMLGITSLSGCQTHHRRYVKHLIHSSRRQKGKKIALLFFPTDFQKNPKIKTSKLWTAGLKHMKPESKDSGRFMRTSGGWSHQVKVLIPHLHKTQIDQRLRAQLELLRCDTLTVHVIHQSHPASTCRLWRGGGASVCSQ